MSIIVMLSEVEWLEASHIIFWVTLLKGEW
jgi:hypothetical protein